MENHLDALKSMYFVLQIQLGAFTAHGSHTDWTKSFPINAIGSSGNFTAKLGENSYKVQLCHFLKFVHYGHQLCTCYVS